jgi:ABC-2 type transport system permease protein
MRNTWVILKREYLERVRTRTFLVLTLLAPAFMTALMILPVKLATMGQKPEHIVIVVSTQKFGDTIRQQLLAKPLVGEETEGEEGTAQRKTEERYTIDVDTTATEAERAALRDKISARDIDGFLWLTDDAIAAHTVSWDGRERGGSRDESWISDVVNSVVQRQELGKKGLTAD